MALFATKYLRSISSYNHLAGTNIKIVQRAFSSSRTNTPDGTDDKKFRFKFNVDQFPIIILGGFTMVAVVLAVRSVTQQLIHHPGVQVNKGNRSMVPEVDSPELSLAYGDKFISRSVLRKVAHIQKLDDTMETDRGDIYTTDGSVNRKTLNPREANLEQIAGDLYAAFVEMCLLF